MTLQGKPVKFLDGACSKVSINSQSLMFLIGPALVFLLHQLHKSMSTCKVFDRTPK